MIRCAVGVCLALGMGEGAIQFWFVIWGDFSWVGRVEFNGVA